MSRYSMLIPLCSTTDVLEGQGLQVTAADLVVAVFRIDDRYYVIDDACTHGPGRLCEGTVEGDIVECIFHNGAFNIRTGEVESPPCLIPIRTYYTEVHDDQIWIDPERPAEP